MAGAGANVTSDKARNCLAVLLFKKSTYGPLSRLGHGDTGIGRRKIAHWVILGMLATCSQSRGGGGVKGNCSKLSCKDFVFRPCLGCKNMGLFFVSPRSFPNMKFPWNPYTVSLLCCWNLFLQLVPLPQLLVCSMDSAVSPPFTLLFPNAFGPSYLPS